MNQIILLAIIPLSFAQYGGQYGGHMSYQPQSYAPANIGYLVARHVVGYGHMDMRQPGHGVALYGNAPMLANSYSAPIMSHGYGHSLHKGPSSTVYYKMTPVKMKTDMAKPQGSNSNMVDWSKVNELIVSSHRLLDESIKEDPHLNEGALYMKVETYLELFKKLDRCLKKMFKKHLFPIRLIELTDRTYNKLSNTLLAIVVNLNARIEGTLAHGGHPSYMDINNRFKFDQQWIEVQQLRNEQLKALTSKNIYANHMSNNG